MIALSLWQPHAQAIALGLKPYETRSWRTKYRGPLVIHAAKKPFRHKDYPLDYYQDVCRRLKEADCPHFALPYGCAVCVVDLVDCVPTDSLRGRIPRNHEFWGDFESGRFAFRLENMRRLNPYIPAKGRQGWFEIELEQSPAPDAQADLFGGRA